MRDDGFHDCIEDELVVASIAENLILMDEEVLYSNGS